MQAWDFFSDFSAASKYFLLFLQKKNEKKNFFV